MTDLMRMWPISTRVNKPEIDDAEKRVMTMQKNVIRLIRHLEEALALADEKRGVVRPMWGP